MHDITTPTPAASPAPEHTPHPGILREQSAEMVRRADDRIAWLQSQLDEANAARRVAMAALDVLDGPPQPTVPTSDGGYR